MVPATQDYARAYLDLHEVPAEFIVAEGHFGTVLDLLAARQMSLALIGGYSVSALEEVFIGSAVNFLLRDAPCPVLICR